MMDLDRAAYHDLNVLYRSALDTLAKRRAAPAAAGGPPNRRATPRSRETQRSSLSSIVDDHSFGPEAHVIARLKGPPDR